MEAQLGAVLVSTIAATGGKAVSLVTFPLVCPLPQIGPRNPLHACCNTYASSSNISGRGLNGNLSPSRVFVLWSLQISEAGASSLLSLFPELDNVLGLIQPHNLTHTGINHTGITRQLMSNRDDSSFYLL